MTTFGEALDEARQLLRQGDLVRAEFLYRRLVEAVPQAPDPWHEMGLVQLQARRPERALEYFRRAIALDPSVSAYHSNLGTACRALKRHDEAVASFKRGMQLEAPTAPVYNNFALALKDAGRRDDALAAFDEALKLRPDYANGHFNRANLLLDVGRLQDSIEGYQRAIQLKSDDAGAHGKLGIAYYDLGRLPEALACFERALALDPNQPEVRRNRALVWLAQGDFAKGWLEYEWRFECEGFAKRSYSQPRWHGSPLAGRTLLVYAEQGLGDTLHFIRYVPLVEQAGGNVLLDVPGPLVPLLTQSGFGRFFAGGTPRFDLHCSLLSLAGMLGEPTGQPLWRGPYLTADPRLVAEWKERLRDLSGFKVGIAWAGNPDHPHDRFRSVSLERFAPLAAISGVRLISLQKGVPSQQLAQFGAAMHVLDLGQALDESTGAFMDTAAVMTHLDLVITVDTAMAHLAGGLGAKVWLPLQLSPDWRWLAHGQETPWYPSMRLFRQREFDRWLLVFEAIAAELGRLSQDSLSPGTSG